MLQYLYRLKICVKYSVYNGATVHTGEFTLCGAEMEIAMTLINKDKFLNGVGKAVDAANNAADKADQFIKENEIDKKAKNVANEFADGIKSVGTSIENLFKK